MRVVSGTIALMLIPFGVRLIDLSPGDGQTLVGYFVFSSWTNRS